MTIIMDRRNTLVIIVISAAIMIAAISITGFSILVFAQQQEHGQQVQQQQKFIVQQLPSSSADPIINKSSSTANSLPDVFERVENSVVQITSTRTNPNEIIIENGVPQTGRSIALGSGFVYDNQGHIVTNYHVIDGTRRADVTFTDGNTYSANVAGRDRYSDLVVLQITGNYSEENVTPLPLANSSAIRPGEQVISIGNPFGLSGTITTGIVSA